VCLRHPRNTPNTRMENGNADNTTDLHWKLAQFTLSGTFSFESFVCFAVAVLLRSKPHKFYSKSNPERDGDESQH
jgi:hypothetical protein